MPTEMTAERADPNALSYNNPNPVSGHTQPTYEDF